MNNFILLKNDYFPIITKVTNYKQKIYFFIREIIGLVLLLIGRNFYIKSLKGCDGDEFKCVAININYIYDDINYCFKSILYFLLFLLIFHLKILSKYQIIIFFLIILELLLKDTGDSFLHHGILNFLALGLFLIIGESVILIIK